MKATVARKESNKSEKSNEFNKFNEFKESIENDVQLIGHGNQLIKYQLKKGIKKPRCKGVATG